MKVIVTKGVITSEGTFQKGAEAEVSDGLGTSLINSGQAKKGKSYGTGEGTSTGGRQQAEGKKGKRTRSTTSHKDGGSATP
ncbi:hypothetical protein OSG_eHP30_00245 [environmental Halophage eHP-30]|nr:hypothetical protein OSG_eHP30_00245 [environmental Halophage eHP-30]